ncbi:prepilin peptidase [Carboxydothermus ferrireducens]|uniref:Prepilin leader peptidase/N-methyltransferase n=1 Tax=Carboxydothermus ferrireducens DSM 11255 TaxID=1119529 RepID=A0ABX2R5Q7_9THEO|nr:A24 family peptidase [Carboxydothermus ferrireducens]NYE56507.1 leader peptidase (prepilin peptidase)/N-methyltransferase [Carboxydothermus ferrireducens DSM 11255]
MEVLIIFLFGLIIGSFLNVVIYRLPRGQSILYPPSTCPNCGQRLKPWHLIPVVSFLLQKGRCAYCGGKISFKYPLVELITAFIFSVVYMKFGLSFLTLKHLLFFIFLIPLFFLDLENYLLPDKLTYPLFLAGILINLITRELSWKSLIFGVITGFGLLFLLALISRGGIGGGDIKLAAGLGAFLGFPLILETLFLAFFFGGLTGIILLLTKKKARGDMVPFGPFLIGAAFITVLWGEKIIKWYLKIFFL